MELTYEEVELLFQALGSHIHAEQNCAGAVDPEVTKLHKKMGDYLHG